MQSKFFVLSGMAGGFVLAGAATAAFTGLSWEKVDADALGWTDAGYDDSALDTYRIYASFDDDLGLVTGVGDILEEDPEPQIFFSLSSSDGAFWNSSSPTAGDFASDAALWSSFADLQWDTFITIGSDRALPVDDENAFGALNFSAQAMGMAGDFTLDDTGWAVAGFPPSGNAVDGRVLVAQITVAEGVGVEGRNWRVSGLAVAGDNTSDYDVLADFTIPAPGVLALLGVAGLVSSRRRR